MKGTFAKCLTKNKWEHDFICLALYKIVKSGTVGHAG